MTSPRFILSLTPAQILRNTGCKAMAQDASGNTFIYSIDTPQVGVGVWGLQSNIKTLGYLDTAQLTVMVDWSNYPKDWTKRIAVRKEM